jgi:hypothetical protein
MLFHIFSRVKKQIIIFCFEYFYSGVCQLRWLAVLIHFNSAILDSLEIQEQIIVSRWIIGMFRIKNIYFLISMWTAREYDLLIVDAEGKKCM